jgi:hypothetical protein
MEALRQNKAQLLHLLRFEFLLVRFDTLETLVFLTRDEKAREALIAAGADTGNIYTYPELQHMINCRITVEQLSLLHMVKRKFEGKFTQPGAVSSTHKKTSVLQRSMDRKLNHLQVLAPEAYC